MKRQILFLLMMSMIFHGFAQNPNGNPGNSRDWRRGGNLAAPPGQGGTNNIFGTFFNSPIYTYTNSLPRMKLNGATTSDINGYTNNDTEGFLLLGNDATSFGGPNLYTDLGAYSLLHLNGSTGNDLQEYGYRPWMRTGVTFTDNSDLSYFGLRALGRANQLDNTETVIMWSDNPVNNQWGPDKMVFRFSGWGGNDGATVSQNRLSTTDLDGLHVAQFTGYGFMGLGNTFGTDVGTMGANYIDPQSLLHLSYDRRGGAANEGYGFMQITYRANANLRGSGETNRDGLRLGIDNQINNPIQGMYSYLRWQENTPFVIQTDWNDGAGGIENGERMRTTTTGALINDPNYFGINGNGGNISRVSISRNGGNPVERPMSLLHLGFDVVQGATGWRRWMDVGSLYSIGGRFGDNMYVGMKREAGADRFDAVINWGDNQPNNGIGSDYLRFIFTSNVGGQGDSISGTNDGLEVMRMDPKNGQTYTYNNFGMVGIGNFALNGPNTDPEDVIDAKLDIDGDLRIRKTEQNDTLFQFLVIDSTDHNRVYWKEMDIPISCWDLNGNGIKDSIEDINGDGSWDALDCQMGLIGAHNGTSISTIDPTKVALGNDIGGTQAQLLSKREIPMNNFNLYFTDNNANGTSQNRIGVGTYAPNARLHLKVNDQVSESLPKGLIVDNNQTSNNSYATGIEVNVKGNNSSNTGQIISIDNTPEPKGIQIYSDNGNYSRGINSTVRNASDYGSAFEGVVISYTTLAQQSVGVAVKSINAVNNYGISAHAQNTLATPATSQYGIYASASGASSVNYGVYGAASQGVDNWAGFFNGDMHVQGQGTATNGFVTASDMMFKTDTASLIGAKDLINQLTPRTFRYDTTTYSEFNFESDLQMGFIAQEVEQVLPNIVSSHTKPAEYDSLGNVISPSLDYKGVEYEEIIPLLVAGMKDQNSVIDSISVSNDSLLNVIDSMKNVMNGINTRLTNLENCLGNILPLLCQMNQSMIQQNDQNVQEELRSIINVELENGENIVLNQNVPNPFAEQTVITYSIPESVGEAMIMFYDSRGVIIKEVKIETRGRGQLNVYGSDLSRGLYSYTLVADGQIIATKKMVKQ